MLLNITQPYQKVTLQFLARELKLTEVDVESLLVDMILAARLSAQIDQIQGFVVLGGDRESMNEKKMKTMGRWADTLYNLNESMGNKIM